MTPAQFLKGYPKARRIFAAIRKAAMGEGVTIRAAKSQIAFSAGRGFAWAWLPQTYLRGKTAELVLSIRLRKKDGSKRWKEIVRPSASGYMHHLELNAVKDVDAEVRGWLCAAREQAKGRDCA